MTEERTTILPLAITTAEGERACVAGLTTQGKWVRPQEIQPHWITQDTPRFNYQHWIALPLTTACATDARPEDHTITRDTGWAQTECPQSDKYHLIQSYQDKDAHSAFSGQRSAGIIAVELHELYLKPSTKRRTFLRAIFSDASGEQYDWIVPEYSANQHAKHDLTLYKNQLMSQGDLFFSIGLTLPNNRFPGLFRGCHPLVVGIHHFSNRGNQIT